MKIASSIEQYFDDEGRPLVNGRVSFYKHDSDILADIYFLTGSDYVHAENPLLTADDGRVPTVFFEAAVVDVKVEKMTSPDTWELMDTFEIGFDYPKAANETLAYGMEGLQNTDPAVGMVQVVGYWNSTDAPARWYVWDENCNLAADGGVIVESNVGEEGRWILLWDDELLPSSLYGIVPGENEANLSAFMNYPDFVGSYQIRTPAMPRFMSGSYISNSNFATQRTLYFDRGAQFLYATLVCQNAVIPDWDSYVSDFSFNGKDVTVHSSWFRTMQSFWHCDASRYIIDDTNYCTSYALTTSASLSAKYIEGSTRLPIQFQNSSWIRFVNCAIAGTRLFSPRYDKYIFSSMVFKQEWFVLTGQNLWDFGKISEGHCVEVLSSANNSIRFENFQTPDVYMKACLANGDTVFDGHGARYTSLTNNTQFDEIYNAVLANQYGLTDTACNTWKDVQVINGLTFSGGNRYIQMEGCSFNLSGTSSTQSVASISLNDCYVGGGGTWCPSYTSMSVNRSTFNAKVELSAAAKSSRTVNKGLAFRNCTVGYTGNWIVNNIVMMDCVTNTHFKLVPYSDSGTLRAYCDFTRNTFTQGALIEINAEDPSTEGDVWGVVLSVTFKDNKFNQEDTRGIVIPHLTNNFDRNKPFLGNGSASVYQGNTGNCPLEHMTPMFLSREMTETLSFGTWSIRYMPRVWAKRVWNLNKSNYYSNGYGWMCTPDFEESWNIYTGRDASMYESKLLHYAYLTDGADNNDQFEVVHCWLSSDAFSDNKLVVLPVLDYGH